MLHLGQKVVQPAFVPAGANQNNELKVLSASGDSTGMSNKGKTANHIKIRRFLADNWGSFSGS